MHPELKQHPEYFSKQIIPLAENVYMAFGFAASNVYMIVGVESVTIIDTTETTAAASNICLLYTSPSPRDRQKSRMPSSA